MLKIEYIYIYIYICKFVQFKSFIELHWLIDWLIDWLVDLFIDWLIAPTSFFFNCTIFLSSHKVSKFWTHILLSTTWVSSSTLLLSNFTLLNSRMCFLLSFLLIKLCFSSYFFCVVIAWIVCKQSFLSSITITRVSIGCIKTFSDQLDFRIFDWLSVRLFNLC